MGDIEVVQAFALIAELALKLDAQPMHKHDPCWECAIDGEWWIAVNGHKEPRKCTKGVEIQPFHCYVEFNGWPAGMFNPRGGSIAAGAVANEETFCKALETRIAEEEA